VSVYGRTFAAAYDALMAGSEKAVLRDHRKALVGRVAGHMIEIGGGTGANLPFYASAVEELVITEPEEPMARRLPGRRAHTRPAAQGTAGCAPPDRRRGRPAVVTRPADNTIRRRSALSLRARDAARWRRPKSGVVRD